MYFKMFPLGKLPKVNIYFSLLQKAILVHIEKLENTDKVGNRKYKHSHYSAIILLVYVSVFIFFCLPHFHSCKLITFIGCFSAMLLTHGSDLLGSDLFAISSHLACLCLEKRD